MDPNIIVNSLQPVAEIAYHVDKVLEKLRVDSQYSNDKVMMKEVEKAIIIYNLNDLSAIKDLSTTSPCFPEILVEPLFLNTVTRARNEADMALTVLSSYLESIPPEEASNSEGRRTAGSLHDRVRNLSISTIHKLREIKIMDIQQRWNDGFAWYGHELRIVESSIPVNDQTQNERYLVRNWYHEAGKLWCTISMMPDVTHSQIKQFKAMMPFEVPSKDELKGQQIDRGYPGGGPQQNDAQWQEWKPKRGKEMEWVQQGIRVFVVGLWRSEREMASVHPWVMSVNPYEPKFDMSMAFD